jgi:proteasome lid subunit RPN8/RPN11
VTATSKRVEGSAKAQFPGGGVDPTPGELRIAIDKKPYAEIIGHSVLEPDVEVCGVLVGSVLQDQRGEFLHITAAIRGEAAKQQGAQVTFTHDTWNHIHREMDQRHADKQMVGWYHTHGGFGIFLSDMDAFIHRNFFSAPYQVAYVFDPLAGSEGFFQSRDGKLELCRRYWVGGRERKAVARDAAEPAAGTEPATRSATGDLAPVSAALQRTAAALQAMASRPQESVPLLVWIAGAVLALAVAFSFATGRGPFASHPGSEAKRGGAMLILQRDPRGGPVIGLELHQAWPVEGAVVRDENGRLYMGMDLRGVDGAPVALGSLFGPQATPSAPAAAAPDPGMPESQVERAPVAGRSTILWASSIAAAVLAAAAAGAWLWLRRRAVG